MASGLTTPVVFIVFNRPDQTAKVFSAIRDVRPSQLFVIADGPRPDVVLDAQKCAAVRTVLDGVDWPCQIFRKFAKQNIGLRRNVAEGLDWVFEQAERAIILEDDCLPDPTFFPFCEELIERYAQDRQVAAISGTNLDPDYLRLPGGESYYFSRFCHIWGWATWRRAWRYYDGEMKEWPALAKGDWLARKIETPTAINFWRRHFDDCVRNHPDGLGTWDVQLVFAFWLHDLLAITPRNNLITNLGFGIDAAHTRSRTRTAQLPTEPMQFPLRHPKEKIVNAAADHNIQDNFFERITPWQRLYWKLRLPLPIWAVRKTRRWFGKIFNRQ